jgi:hypothetical protein
MTIYRVQVFEVGETPAAIVSSYRAPRTNTKTEFYASKEKAEARMAELRNSITMLSGFTRNYEIDLTPIEVIE